MTSSLVSNPRWRLFFEGERLFLSGGADEVYLLDEVPTAAAAQRLLTAAENNNFDSLAQDIELAAALRQLRNIGAIATRVPITTPVSIALLWAGNAQPALQSALSKLLLSNHSAVITDAANASLAIFVRTNASWLDTIATYEEQRFTIPHLLVDLAYRNTVGIGPYVVAKETACIACLGHRLAHQWGDAPLPSQPNATLQTDLVAGLISNIVADFAAHGMCTHYLERAVSLNLQTLSSQRDRVFRLPWCPHCGRAPSPAPLALPW